MDTLGTVVSQKLLDTTPAHPISGAGSALFGLYLALDDNGELLLYFTDDNSINLAIR